MAARSSRFSVLIHKNHRKIDTPGLRNGLCTSRKNPETEARIENVYSAMFLRYKYVYISPRRDGEKHQGQRSRSKNIRDGDSAPIAFSYIFLWDVRCLISSAHSRPGRSCKGIRTLRRDTQLEGNPTPLI